MSLSPDEAFQKIITFLRQQQTTLLLDENIDIPGIKEHFFQAQELLQYLISEIFDINPENIKEEECLSTLFRLTQTRTLDNLILEIYKRVKMSPLYIDDEYTTDNYSEQIYNLYHNSQSYLLGNDTGNQNDNVSKQQINQLISSGQFSEEQFQNQKISDGEYFNEHPAVSLSPSETPGLLVQSAISKGKGELQSPTAQRMLANQQDKQLDDIHEEQQDDNSQQNHLIDFSRQDEKDNDQQNKSHVSLENLSSIQSDLSFGEQLMNAVPAMIGVGASFSSIQILDNQSQQSEKRQSEQQSNPLFGRQSSSQDIILNSQDSSTEIKKNNLSQPKQKSNIPPKQPQQQKQQQENNQQSGLNIQQIIHELAAYKEFKYKLEQHLNIKIEDISRYDVTNLRLVTLSASNSALTSDDTYVNNQKQKNDNTSLCLYNNESFDYRKIESRPSTLGNADESKNQSMNKSDDRLDDKSYEETDNNKNKQNEIPQSLQLEGTLKSPEVLQLELKIQQQEKQIALYNNQLKWIFSYLNDIGTEFRIDSVSKVHGLHQKLSGLQTFLKKREAEWLQQEAGEYQQALITKYQKLVGQLRQQVTTLHMKLKTLQSTNINLIQESQNTKQQLKQLQHSNFGLQKRVKNNPGESILSIIEKQKNTARILMQQADAIKRK